MKNFITSVDDWGRIYFVLPTNEGNYVRHTDIPKEVWDNWSKITQKEIKEYEISKVVY